MKTAMTILVLVVMSLSPVVRIAQAGVIQATPVSQEEARDLAAVEADSATQLADLAAADGGDAAVAVAALLLLIILLAAASSAGTAA